MSKYVSEAYRDIDQAIHDARLPDTATEPTERILKILEMLNRRLEDIDQSLSVTSRDLSQHLNE